MTAFNESERRARVSAAFRPDNPVTKKSLFADPARIVRLTQTVETLQMRPRCVFVSGERGVGKSSFARVLPKFLRAAGWSWLQEATVNANSREGFGSLARKLLADLRPTVPEDDPDLAPAGPLDEGLAAGLSESCTPEDVVRRLQSLRGEGGGAANGRDGLGHALLVVDEVDKVREEDVLQGLSELAKSLADNRMDTVLVLVGMFGAAMQFLASHPSLARSLHSVELDRMNRQGAQDVLARCSATIDLEFGEKATALITHLTQGLPQTAHLLGFGAAHA
jgi:hypothetical protein